VKVSRLLVAALAAAGLAVGWTASAARTPKVPCDEMIAHTRFPYRASGYRVVLGAVAVPPAFLRQVVATGERPWTHWRKAGLVVRAGAQPVTVSVPLVWRRRAAVTWGNSTGIVEALRVDGCAGARAVGHAYAGVGRRC
jgi:hypothetical protein